MGREGMKLPKRLAGRKGVVLDTMIFIYLFEDSRQFASVSEFILEQIDEAEVFLLSAFL
jgi:hypothetical protein